MTSASTRPERPGRPRDPEVGRSILAAARELVTEHGYGSVTLGAIAERAGVGRPTIYRRWNGKADLVFDALFEATETVDFPETGELATDLRSIGRVIARDMSSPASTQALIAVMAEVGDAGVLAERIRDHTIKPRTADVAVVVTNAQERGQARPDIDPVMAINALTGILYYHAAVLGEPITRDGVDAVVDLVLHGIAAAGAGTDAKKGPS